jgi:NAD(P)H-dependent FMN reductase
VLKNAIDWASRPPAETPLRHKPIALMGAQLAALQRWAQALHDHA